MGATRQPTAVNGPPPCPRQSLFRKLQRSLGFRNDYDFILWTILSGMMALFTFIRLPYLHPPTFRRHANPGEFYWFGRQPYEFAIFLHLFTVLPAGFLAIFQFIPAIRTKAISVHKTLGYAVMFLLFLGDIGAVLMSRRAMGGDVATQAAIAYLTIATIGSMYLAWYNIKRQQIDEHRKWMLRAMIMMSIIITERIIQIFLVLILSFQGGYHTLWTCDEVMFVTGNTTAFQTEFPACRLGPDTFVGVPADIRSNLHIGSAVRLTFAAATWLAIAVHTVSVELYLHLTPKESERLRILSYHKQRSMGLANPGSAGITADRWGDGFPWKPPLKVTE